MLAMTRRPLDRLNWSRGDFLQVAPARAAKACRGLGAAGGKAPDFLARHMMERHHCSSVARSRHLLPFLFRHDL